MKYNRYLRNGPKVSAIGLGGWQLGESPDWESMTEKEAIELVNKSIEFGINFFDTAPNYGNGSSEERLGKALEGKDRTKIVINTKFGHTDSGVINFEATNIRKSLEGSLKRLKTDYVDSLIIHNPPIKYLDGNKNDHYEILEKLVEEEKILAYGASLDTYDEMSTFMNTTNGKVIEAFFNIFHQGVRHAFDLANQKDVRIIAKIPLDSGWLSGKYNSDSTFLDIRNRWSKEDIKIRADLVEKLKIKIPKDKNLAQVAISFCLAYDAVATVIPGNKSIDQLKRNLESIDNGITEKIVRELEYFYKEEVENLNLPW
jgi:aryl-alcohol dehydrogenase-like predicted oxidoreductase